MRTGRLAENCIAKATVFIIFYIAATTHASTLRPGFLFEACTWASVGGSPSLSWYLRLLLQRITETEGREGRNVRSEYKHENDVTSITSPSR